MLQIADAVPTCNTTEIDYNAAEIHCAFSYSGNMEPSLVCTSGSDAHVVLTRMPTERLITYKKKLQKLQGESDMLKVNCTLSVTHVPGFINVPMSPLINGGRMINVDLSVALSVMCDVKSLIGIGIYVRYDDIHENYRKQIVCFLTTKK